MFGRRWRGVAIYAAVGGALLATALVSPDGDIFGSAAAQAVAPTNGQAPQPEAPPPPDPREGFDLSALVEQEGRLVQPVGDRTIVTTLDPQLQQFALDLLARYDVPDGAAVAINSRTGEVLVLAQHSERSPGRQVALIADAPAASMFKVVTAAAILDLTDLEPTTQTCYHGGARGIEADLLDPDPARDTLCASFGMAMGRSINVIFARLADQNLTAANLSQYIRVFGFNVALPFDLPLQSARADVPTERLERARMSAGFWHSYVSPLHAAAMAQAVAQNGALLRPYVIDEVRDDTDTLIYDGHPQFLSRVCTADTADQLAEMMVLTTTSGTARSSFHDQQGRAVIPGVDVAGKTGTLHGRNPFRAYDWFMGFAPADNPEIAVAGLVVNDPEWRIKGHYVAREILRRYFQLQRQAQQGS